MAYIASITAQYSINTVIGRSGGYINRTNGVTNSVTPEEKKTTLLTDAVVGFIFIYHKMPYNNAMLNKLRDI